MAGDQFGFQVGELLKIQRDFEQVNQRMEEMTGKIGHIKATIAKAAVTDVFSGGILGIFGAAKVLEEVTSSVREIHARTEEPTKAKEKLTKELGEDAAKIKKMLDAYGTSNGRSPRTSSASTASSPSPPRPSRPTPGSTAWAAAVAAGAPVVVAVAVAAVTPRSPPRRTPAAPTPAATTGRASS